jgi:hypothetical protein
MRIHLALLLVITAALSPSPHRANDTVWIPPNLPGPEELPNPTIPQPMITSFRIDGFPISMQQTDLDAAARHFMAVAGHRGDAADAISWLCFHGTSESGPWALWLTSDEVDGPAIGGFQWQRLNAGEKIDSRCKQLGGSSPLRSSFSIRLGMSESRIEHVMGPPTKRYRRTSLYFHHHDLTIHGQPYSADNMVYFTYRNGRLWSVAVSYQVVS